MPSGFEFLLVDDDDSKRALIGHFLLRRFPGARLCEVSTGRAAIERLEAGRIDAVVTDHTMFPINGIELIRWTRTRFEKLPILMVTGHPAIEEQALDAGATSVLSFERFAEVGEILARLLQVAPLKAVC